MWTYKCVQCVYTYIRSNFAKNKLAFLVENYYYHEDDSKSLSDEPGAKSDTQIH